MQVPPAMAGSGSWPGVGVLVTLHRRPAWRGTRWPARATSRSRSWKRRHRLLGPGERERRGSASLDVAALGRPVRRRRRPRRTGPRPHRRRIDAEFLVGPDGDDAAWLQDATAFRVEPFEVEPVHGLRGGHQRHRLRPGTGRCSAMRQLVTHASGAAAPARAARGCRRPRAPRRSAPASAIAAWPLPVAQSTASARSGARRRRPTRSAPADSRAGSGCNPPTGARSDP